MSVLFSTLSHDVLMARKGGKAADALTHRISGVAEYLRQASYRFIEFNRSSVSTLCGGLGRVVTPKAVASCLYSGLTVDIWAHLPFENYIRSNVSVGSDCVFP